MAKKLPRSYARRCYNNHLHSAKSRGIAFELTFEEWDAWWLSHGVDREIPRIHNSQILCMCRHNDNGPYKLSNVYCATNSRNASDAHINVPKNKKPIQTPKGQFSSITDAAIAYGIHLTTMQQRLRENKPGYHYL